MPPNKSGKQDAKPFNRSGSKPFNRAPASAARSSSPSPKPSAKAAQKPGADDEQKILFQKFFKSVGPRTYAAQVKQARNGNYFIVLTEGKRDPETDEVRKTKLLVFSEDFKEFFKLLNDMVGYLRDHPVPAEIREKRERFWARRNSEQKSSPPPPNGQAVKPPPVPAQPRPRAPENRNRK